MKPVKLTQSFTERTDVLASYFPEVNRIKLLTIDEEVALAQRIQRGDEAAVNLLVEANLRFVISVAKQYQGQGLPLEDLISEGNIGLMRAARKFDPTCGVRFITYAVWWIRQAINDALVSCGNAIRIPVNQVNVANRVNRAYQQFCNEHERTPSDAELAELLQMSEERVNEILHLSTVSSSIDIPVGDDGDSTIADLIVGDDDYAADKDAMLDSLRQEIAHVLHSLSECEATVITKMFGLDGHEYTCDEVATSMHLSRERIRQIRDTALRRMRRRCYATGLRPYLG